MGFIWKLLLYCIFVLNIWLFSLLVVLNFSYYDCSLLIFMGPYIYSEFSKCLGQQFSKYEAQTMVSKHFFQGFTRTKLFSLTVLNAAFIFFIILIFSSAVAVQKQWWAVTALESRAVVLKCTGSHLIFNARHPHWEESQCHLKISFEHVSFNTLNKENGNLLYARVTLAVSKKRKKEKHLCACLNWELK